MIAKLIHKNNYYYCSKCHMKQDLKPYCNFCGVNFSNYEEVLIKIFKDSEEDYSCD